MEQSLISGRLTKRVLAGASFEEAFLEYLGERWNAETLPHYVMAAIQVCEGRKRYTRGPSYSWPEFVTGYLEWLSFRFLYGVDDDGDDEVPEMFGQFRQHQANDDKLSHQKGRFKDCFNLFHDWYNERAIDFAGQVMRSTLVEMVEDRGSKNDEDLYHEIAEAFCVSVDDAWWFKRKFKRLTEPNSWMCNPFAIALIPERNGYSIVSWNRIEADGRKLYAFLPPRDLARKKRTATTRRKKNSAR